MIGKKDIEGFGNDLTDRVPYIPVQLTDSKLPAWIVRAHIAFLKKHSTGGIPYTVRQEFLPDTTRSKRRSVRAT